MKRLPVVTAVMGLLAVTTLALVVVAAMLDSYKAVDLGFLGMVVVFGVGPGFITSVRIWRGNGSAWLHLGAVLWATVLDVFAAGFMALGSGHSSGWLMLGVLSGLVSAGLAVAMLVRGRASR